MSFSNKNEAFSVSRNVFRQRAIRVSAAAVMGAGVNQSYFLENAFQE